MSRTNRVSVLFNDDEAAALTAAAGILNPTKTGGNTARTIREAVLDAASSFHSWSDDELPDAVSTAHGLVSPRFSRRHFTLSTAALATAANVAELTALIEAEVPHLRLLTVRQVLGLVISRIPPTDPVSKQLDPHRAFWVAVLSPPSDADAQFVADLLLLRRVLGETLAGLATAGQGELLERVLTAYARSVPGGSHGANARWRIAGCPVRSGH